MGKFIIEPHFRLHEWVAEEKGYFKSEGLDYIFRETVQSTDGKHHETANKVGAYQSIEAGRKADVSCACHWTIGVAASAGHGKLFGELYSVSPAGVFVAPESGITSPEDLAGVPISVGYQSGSHYATVQGLEQYLKPDGTVAGSQGAGGASLQRTILLRRATRVPKGHRHHLHDGDDGARRSGYRGPAQIRPCA
jgi:hypothetical protein